MTRMLLAGVAAFLLGTAAQAADLPSRVQQPAAPAIVASPGYNWTGFYAGVNAGYAWSADNKARFGGNPAALAFVNAGIMPPALSPKSQGFVGGGQLGVNYQIGSFVVGAETDLQYMGRSKSAIAPGISGNYASLKSETSYLGTARARLGFTPVDRWLVYATGGLAYGNVKNTAGFSAPSLGGADWSGHKSDTKVGWTIGAGTEYAFTKNLSGKLEYLYYDLGASKNALGAINASAIGTGAYPSLKAENRGQLARVGLNYKF